MQILAIPPFSQPAMAAMPNGKALDKYRPIIQSKS